MCVTSERAGPSSRGAGCRGQARLFGYRASWPLAAYFVTRPRWTMTSPDVEKALSNLCDFRPAEWGPDAERDPEESLKKGEEAENLIRLTSRFVESLDD